MNGKKKRGIQCPVFEPVNLITTPVGGEHAPVRLLKSPHLVLGGVVVGARTILAGLVTLFFGVIAVTRSNLTQRLQVIGRMFAQRRLRFFWWFAVTPGLGLLQVWAVVLIIFIIQSFFPGVQLKLGNTQLGIERILGNSVLLFFGATLLGQAVYTLWSRDMLVGYHLFFAGAFLVATLIPLIALYVITILSGEAPMPQLYVVEIVFTGVVLVYTGYVELFTV